MKKERTKEKEGRDRLVGLLFTLSSLSHCSAGVHPGTPTRMRIFIPFRSMSGPISVRALHARTTKCCAVEYSFECDSATDSIIAHVTISHHPTAVLYRVAA